jgi:hypothetical protein
MSAEILEFNTARRASKIGAPPSGRILPAVERADVVSLDNLSPRVEELFICRQAMREMKKLNAVRADIGDEPIFYSEKEWVKKVYEATQGWLWGHPSQDQLAAHHRGEPIEY